MDSFNLRSGNLSWEGKKNPFLSLSNFIQCRSKKVFLLVQTTVIRYFKNNFEILLSLIVFKESGNFELIGMQRDIHLNNID